MLKRRTLSPQSGDVPSTAYPVSEDLTSSLLNTMKPKTVAIAIAGFALLILLQMYGLKYVFSGSQKLLEERPPWEAMKLLFDTCDKSGLTVFVIEPSLLRAVREGTRLRLDMWNHDRHTSVAVGVRDAGLDEMHLVMSAMRRNGYEFWEKVDADPRGLTLTGQRSYRVVTSHFLLWVPVAGHTPMVIHIVVFYKRGSYYWHSGLEDRLHPPPFNLSEAVFGSSAGAFSNFDLSTKYLEGVKFQYPNDTSEFLRDLSVSEFIECNYTRAYLFYAEYRMDKSKEAEIFRRRARQLLFIAKAVLDDMDIPFWLSSGTCLGWYRQCDMISHTTDVDIGIFIKDFREEMVPLLENKGLSLTNRFGKVSDSLELSFLYGDLKLDIFFFYEANNYTWNGGTQASTGLKFKYIFPKFHLCWTEFLDMWLRAPCPTAPYIHANYGPKWMMPNTLWDWKNSPNNVIENGQWPKNEWDQVIQLYEAT